MQKFISSIDQSVNWVSDEKFESRFVQRTDDYIIAYLSSHNGCNKACRFCHLTQTKQTSFVSASINDYINQLNPVLDHYSKRLSNGHKAVPQINFNFMARGEPLANTTILNDSAAFFSAMNKSVSAYNLKSKFNLSTIGPQEISDRLISEFIKPSPDVSIYYSLYSVKESFRKKWVPKSIPVHIMLENMKDWQSKGGNNVLHWSLIEGENDSIKDIDEIMNLVSKYGIKAKFNLVRYNPYSDMQGREPTQEKIDQYFNHISECLGHIDSKIVSRVGFDIKASCGMFVS